MKKIALMLLTPLLSAILLFGFYGCNNTKTDNKTIKIAAFKGAYGEEFWADLKAGFEELYKDEGYKVDYMAHQEPEATIRSQINVGKAPDIIYMPVGQKGGLTEELIMLKSMVNLNSLLDKEIPGENIKLKDKFINGFIGNMSTNPYNNNDVYMLPLFYAPLGIYYNKSLFSGASAYELPNTWQEFLDLDEQLPEEQSLLVYPEAGYMVDWIYAMIASHCGVETFNNFLNYEDVYETAEFNQVLEAIAELKGKVSDVSMDTATDYREKQDELLKNKSLFMPGGTWLPTEMANYTPAAGFEYGFTAPFVIDEDDDRFAFVKLEQIYIHKQSKKQDIAEKFLLYLYSDNASKIIAQKAKGLTPTKNSLSIATAGNYIDEQTLNFYNIFKDESISAVSGIFATSNWPGVDWTKTFVNNIDTYMKGSITIEEWRDAMQIDAATLKVRVVK